MIETDIPKIDPLDWRKKFTVSADEIEMIADPDFIIPGMVVQGLSHVFVAEPNAGKTTLMMHLAPQMVQAGYEVTYVNSDISAVHAKEAWHDARDGAFMLLLPDMKPELSMRNVVQELEVMAYRKEDLSRKIFIFDTLKKMADVISKPAAKALYATLRKLTAQGMTIICLAHTNKYSDADGKPIYEGTSDLRSDFDNLIYLIPRKNDDGSITVAVEPDKTRAALEQMTFTITRDREVMKNKDHVDVASERAAEKRQEDDQPVISAITDALLKGKAKQVDVIAHCREKKIGEKRVRRVLIEYTGKFWMAEKQFQKNAWRYTLI